VQLTSNQWRRCALSDNVLELRDVEKTYYLGPISVPVLKGVNLKVGPGEFISVMGPSGSGKSTLLNIIGGLDNPTSGRIKVAGIDITDMGEGELSKIRRDKIGFIFQSYNLMPVFTALENVETPMVLAGEMSEKEIREKAISLLTLVGLSGRLDHRHHELSGGENQRVAIARALANDPSIVFADEPTGNLDSESGQTIIHLLKWLSEIRHQSFIIVTHDLEIGQFTNKIYYMKEGKLTEDEPPKTVLPKKVLREQQLAFLASELSVVQDYLVRLIDNSKRPFTELQYEMEQMKDRINRINEKIDQLYKEKRE